MNRLSDDKLLLMKTCLEQGLSVRATTAVVQCSRRTVTTYRWQLLGEFCGCGRPIKHTGFCSTRESLIDKNAPLCECGKPSTHRGWCKWRFARSPARQVVVQRWHKPKINTITPEVSKEVVIEVPKEVVKPFSMFDGLPKVQPVQNRSWRRLDLF